MHRRALPIANPCSERWESMTPAGHDRRHCSRCDKHVHFLSGMTEAAAMRTLDEHRGRDERMCIRYQFGSDGNIRFRPRYEPGFVRGAMLLAGLVLTLTACAEGEMPLQLEESGLAPAPVWVELEPEPRIPDQVLPAKPEVAAARPPRAKRAKRKVAPPLRLDDGVMGDYDF
jgi:hypothetical protein